MNTVIRRSDLVTRITGPAAAPNWQVWINDGPDEEYTGFCIGVGESAEIAVGDAITHIDAIIRHLRYFRKSMDRRNAMMGQGSKP